MALLKFKYGPSTIIDGAHIATQTLTAKVYLLSHDIATRNGTNHREEQRYYDLT